MKILEYKVTFLTPAFLGNAEQNGQWRTPPFKALLRQWWRVAYSADKNFNVDLETMRKEEGLLFGHAWLENDYQDGKPVSARKSEIRLRLSQWSEGKLKSYQGLEQGPVHHPEVEKTKYKIGPHAYLGFGPLDGRQGTKFKEKMNAAIQSSESAILTLAIPCSDDHQIEPALWLMNRYGTLGGRSRNGWGSFSLTPVGNTPPLIQPDNNVFRDWQHALSLDWPHALGKDRNGSLIWETKRAFDDWKLVMRELAEIKIDFRTKFPFSDGKSAHRPEERHWLSYPVTNHSVKSWGNARLPNSLRFKVVPDKKEAGKLRGLIFHVPCRPPRDFRPEQSTLEQVWGKVHNLLDQNGKLDRVTP